MNTLAVRLALPLAGCVEDFHLLVVQLTTTVNRTAPVTALRAMPGAPKKAPQKGREGTISHQRSGSYQEMDWRERAGWLALTHALNRFAHSEHLETFALQRLCHREYAADSHGIA